MNTTVARSEDTSADQENRPPSPVAVIRKHIGSMESQFAAALPKHIPVDRFMRVVMTAVQNNPDLLGADRQSFFNAAVKAAQDGLLPDGREGALVPFRGRVTWMPMVAGIRKKVRNSGEITTWDCHVVYENDEFQFQLGDQPRVHHTYDLKIDRGKIVGVYSVARLKDGSLSYEVMSVGDVYAIRDRSDAWKAFVAKKIKSTPWSTDEAEMFRKTAAKRHAKVLPLSTDLDDLLRRDDELYNFKEAQEEAKAALPRPSNAALLDRFAAGPAAVTETVDPQTGEIGSSEQSGSGDGGRPQEGGDEEDRDASPPEPLKVARDLGAQHASEGRALRAMSPEYRVEGREEEAAAYREGHQSASRADKA